MTKPNTIILYKILKPRLSDTFLNSITSISLIIVFFLQDIFNVNEKKEIINNPSPTSFKTFS